MLGTRVGSCVGVLIGTPDCALPVSNMNTSNSNRQSKGMVVVFLFI